ncbi:MAG: GNAT family N-acetyltransferase [Roseibium album]|uniref:Acetyltransferase (GNAT) family protein n=1 Tax=Roseibium album TaxID=311410 RepID=A0A0M6ZX98_9HYPH|nr:GNAT family N-acetyltransferase [Roseibium album]MBG6145643.1 GNAT superfamily N-acetyltransferase [Labrenzia sp. EL_142]MBG6157662.1 GNAT superfamily N-acetyltransferase [Labrenzia sp. EL_162]MBG6163092.1 GNAT superfamily N-acetyltransferase [Labrenzia sp. EL_195]MBG6174517.1 GNAT superfamily N-acetyltransferase [Labrenzia sp. EL_132]MBG6195945.1 GNAT superfamily N-acetyltransferase [Labrenzia sp. EL_159]MBG6201370.1 GNAT superfamily N-acetyltransferase [Labrenzia sp. EL_13]MBG6229201.1 
MTTAEIRVLGPENAHQLAPLIAENAQALKRGAPRRPDEYYAERILGDKSAEVLGAFVANDLVGFGVYFDLPELITGLRIGQLDDIYVHPDHRNQGTGRKIIETLVSEGQRRGWLHLRWIVPGKNAPAVALYEKIAEPDHRKSYVIPIDRVAGD